MSQLFDDELHEAMQQLFDEAIEAIQLSKVSPDLDDLAATFAVALLKLGLATGFVEQRHPGFAKDIEEKRQRVIAALTQIKAKSIGAKDTKDTKENREGYLFHWFSSFILPPSSIAFIGVYLRLVLSPTWP